MKQDSEAERGAKLETKRGDLLSPIREKQPNGKTKSPSIFLLFPHLSGGVSQIPEPFPGVPLGEFPMGQSPWGSSVKLGNLSVVLGDPR